MKRTITTIAFVFFTFLCFSQKMRPVEELINTKDPGWPLVQEWIAAAKNFI